MTTALAEPVAGVPVCHLQDSAEEVLGVITGRSFECADDIAVLDAGRLVGLLPIERLLAADSEAGVSELMDIDPPTVVPGCDQEAIAWETVRRGEPSVAMVDANGRFLGLVHRLPWLLAGLVGAMAASVMLAAFETTLEENVLLAVFIPAIVYLPAAVGTQTATLLIRGFAAGVRVRAILRREAATGTILGVDVSAMFLPFILVGWDDGEVAVAVALALAAACAVATLVAILLPWALSRRGRDPAFGSGPLATVIQDLLSILVYVAVASQVVG